jgi:two-component system, LuxR family, sensor kinase FixL
MALKSQKPLKKKHSPKNKHAGKRQPLSAAGYRGRMEEALRESEARYRLLFESAKYGIFIADADTGLVVDANPFLNDLLGYPKEQLLGKHLWEISAFKDIAATKESLLELQEKKHLRYEDLPLETADGRKIDVELVGNLYVVNGRKLIQCNISDISERRRAEAEILRQRDELSHITRVATMGELAASIAHEINQPLAAILNNAQAALRFLDAQAPDLDEVRDALKDIIGDDQRAGNVIKELRTLTKKEEPHREPLDMARTIEDVLGILKSDSIIRNITLKKELSADMPHVLGSRVQLQQVIMNLINNGCEAMMETGPEERTLTIRAFTKDLKNIIVEITDRGRGLKEGMPEKMFEPFFTTKPKGLGIGLTISRSIIKAHGGTLLARNNPDKGATVTFTLPAEGAKP